MKSALFDHYKKKYKIGGKAPVKSTGMWYQNGDVVVPSNEITMKGPNGESNFFKAPILGVGMQSGQQQVMQPGQEYSFPGDKSVFETTQFQEGGVNYEQRLKDYINQDKRRKLNLPKGVSVDTEIPGIAKEYTNKKSINDIGDLSAEVKKAILASGLSYEVSKNLPEGLGNINFRGQYNPFGENSREDVLSGLTYNQSFDKGNIRLSPKQQQVNLNSKTSGINYTRNVSDDKVLNQLHFNTQILPKYLSVYGGGQSQENNSVNVQGIDPMQISTNVKGNIGIRGQVGPVNYDAMATYNPTKGVNYNASADASLFNDKLNLRGTVSRNPNTGMQEFDAEANLRLAKNLELIGSYGKQQNQPGTYNLGLAYNQSFEEGGEVNNDKEMVEGIADILSQIKDKPNRRQIANQQVQEFNQDEVEYNLEDFMEAAQLMQMGGMSIPGVNGTIVSAAQPEESLQKAYYAKGGQHGGLDRWFAEKWVDVKSGKACGRQKGESRAYPACRPSKRISSKTPKTSSELSSAERAKFKSSKTSSQRISYNHKRK